MSSYPFADLAAAMRLTEHQATAVLGLSGSTAQDYRHNGMSWRVADRLAVKAGFHPGQVWPEWIDDAIADAHVACADCGTRFIPKRSNHRFCSTHCSDRWRKRHYWHNDQDKRDRIAARKRRHYAENAEYYRAAERRRYHEKKGAA